MRKASLLAVTLVFLTAGALYGDTIYALRPWAPGITQEASSCPGGSCPLPRGPYSQPYGGYDGPYGGYGEGAPFPETTPLPDDPNQYVTQFEATVRVIAQEGYGRQSMGTGVIVRYLGHKVVVTARHVVQSVTRVIIRSYKGKQASMIVIAKDDVWDVAVLAPATEQDAEVLESLAAVDTPDERDPREVLKPGVPVYFIGYAGADSPDLLRGRFRSFHKSMSGPASAADWFAVTPQARPGDSGGPIFDAKGHLVGVLWGAGQGETVGTQYGRVERILESCLRGRAPRRPRQPAPPKPNAPSPGPAPAPEKPPEAPKPEPPKPEPPKPQPPAPPPPPVAESLSPWWIAFPPVLVLVAGATYLLANVVSTAVFALRKRSNA